MKPKLYRHDKRTGEISTFDNGEKAVSQFMLDFGIKTRQTAKIDLFDLLMNPTTKFIQSTAIAWSYSLELIRE